MLVSIGLAITYGFTKDPEYIGMALAGFLISTVGATMFISSVEEEQEELEEELMLQKLEDRIEKLEEELE